MKRIFFTTLLSMLYFCGNAQTNNEIKPYTDFLKDKHLSAKDYILSQFKDNDMVILCERDHRELTQYQLILDVMSDSYFIENVGTVYTEVGARNLNPELNDFLQNKNLTDNEIDSLSLIFQRNCMYPLWEKSNFSVFIKGIHEINKGIQNEKQIKMYPSDIFYVEGEPDAESVRNMFMRAQNRDSLMADFIISQFEKAKPVRKKALVIMNYRHAFRYAMYSDDNRKVNNTGQFLFDKYAGKIVNILINPCVINETRTGVTFGLIQDGKWDAAFRETEPETIGFNFRNTPFGKDAFDLWSYKNNYNYQDVFDGFVFYLPVNKFEMGIGVPGLMENEFYEEYLKQNALQYKAFNRESPVVDKEQIMYLNDIHITPMNNLEQLEAMIEKWLPEK